jgi:hypothetical protein
MQITGTQCERATQHDMCVQSAILFCVDQSDNVRVRQARTA